MLGLNFPSLLYSTTTTNFNSVTTYYADRKSGSAAMPRALSQELRRCSSCMISALLTMHACSRNFGQEVKVFTTINSNYCTASLAEIGDHA